MDFVVVEKSFRELRNDFQILASNAYPYQKPELVEVSYRSLINRLKTHMRVRMFEVYQGDKPVMIAPLKIHKNGIKVLGTQEGYNMSDFIYNTKNCSLLSDAIFALLEYLRKKVFEDKEFLVEWWYLFEESLSYKALHQLADNGRITFCWQPVAINNVQIPLYDTYDAYFKGLSKHARQNIRTAYNRVSRDNHSLSVHFYPMWASAEVMPSARKAYKQYSSIYMKRLAERYHRKGFRFLAKKTLAKISGNGWKTASSPLSLLADISLDDEVAAYAKCYMDLSHNKVTVPNLAIDIKWGFYSPGIILVNELVKYIINLGGVEYLSMGRGEEPYKYEMGGEVYHTYYCVFNFSEKNIIDASD